MSFALTPSSGGGTVPQHLVFAAHRADGRVALLHAGPGRVAVMLARDWRHPFDPLRMRPIRTGSRAALDAALRGPHCDAVSLRRLQEIADEADPLGRDLAAPRRSRLNGWPDGWADREAIRPRLLAAFDRRAVEAVAMPVPAAPGLGDTGDAPPALLRVATGGAANAGLPSMRLAAALGLVPGGPATAAPGTHPPSGVPASLPDRFSEVMRRAAALVPEEMRAGFAALLEPEALAPTAPVLALWAGSHAFGVGFVVDLLLAVAAAVALGVAVFRAAVHLKDAITLAITAEASGDLDRAAGELAAAVTPR